MSALHFRSVVVRRMPGIRDGGFELESLAPGVNVVYGPNASGKTTTARALEALLWPAKSPDGSVWVSATFDLGADRWSAELDAGRARVQRNGEPTGPPHGLPPEASSRYRLELKDLLEAEDRGLARAIGLESAGGYDLVAAASVLAPRRTASRPNSAMAEVRQAREKLAAAKAVQDELQVETATIRSDEARIEAIPELEQRTEYLRLALEHAARTRELREARDRLATFEPVVAKLAGDEDARCTELQRKVAEARDAERAAELAIAKAESELANFALPARMEPAEMLASLEARVVELDRIEAEIRSERRVLEDANVHLRREGDRLGTVDPDRLARLDLRQVADLVALGREVGEVQARKTALDEEIALLGMEPDVGSRIQLEQAIAILQQWLAAPPPDPSFATVRKVSIIASIGLFLLGLGLAILHPAALLVAAAGAFLLNVAIRSAPRIHNPRAGLEARYADAGVEPPYEWSTEAVRRHATELADRSITARLREEAQQRAQRLAAQAEDLTDRLGSVREAFADTAERLGMLEVDPGATGWMLERVSRWQSAHAEVEGAAARLEKAIAQREAELAAARTDLEAARVVGEVADSHGLRVVAQTLSERVRAFRKATAELDAARRERTAASARVVELEAELSSLLDRLGIDPADMGRLGDWCAQRADYLAARRTVDALEAESARVESRLQDFTYFDRSITEADPASLERERAEIGASLQELKALQLKVMELRTKVRQATRGHDIEDALAGVERAEAALRQIRDRDARSALAAVLVEHVERAARNDQRPEVFHRASALFTRLTRGRYELMLDDRTDPGFRAFDTVLEQSLALEELSSATRLQLLLAVRVGFVETQEGGVQLPILMDETLANSDDDRAGAIIAAVVALAAAGRQVFYFTAQRDEVAKWRSVIEAGEGIPGRIIDLAQVRRQEQRLDAEEIGAVTQPLPELPVPGGRSHADYGILLDVPKADPTEPVGALHLWYLIEDPELLYSVMTATRAERWGSLRALLPTGGGRLVPEPTARKIEALAGAAHAALLRMRVGRGRPVDRHALAMSGAVSPRFMEEVSEVLSSVGGAGASLVDALERRAVPKFFQKNIQALREFLEEAGYIDPRPPITPVTIRWEVLNDASRAVEEGVVTVPELERLLARLGVAPEWNQPVPDAEIHPARLQTALEFDW